MNTVSLIRKVVGAAAVSDNISGGIIKKNSLSRPVPVGSHVRAYMLVCAVIAVTGSMAKGDWTHFRFDPAHHGVNPNETILTPANVGGLTVKWRITIRGTNGTNFASVSVLDDKVYVVSVYTSKVHALNKDTGQELWSFPSDAIEGADNAWT